MEDKKVKAGSVAVGICLFVIAILLILIVVFFYNTTMEKNKLQAQIDELETEIEKKDEVSNNSEENNKIKEIILEGDYAIENSDFGYRFYKDGRVEAIGNVEITEGTYYTIGENKIELKFTKRTIDEPEWDEPIVENINEIDKATIKDENTLIIEGEANGEKYEYEIVKYINNEDIDDETFSNDEIKESIQSYLDLIGAYIGSPNALLDRLGFENYDENEVTKDFYKKTNIKYDEYKNKMLDYMTEKCFESKFENFKTVDGFLYYFDGGATGINFEVENIRLKGDYSNFNYIADVYDVAIDGSKELENIEFHIEEQNGKCVISYCDY